MKKPEPEKFYIIAKPCVPANLGWWFLIDKDGGFSNCFGSSLFFYSLKECRSFKKSNKLKKPWVIKSLLINLKDV